MKKAFVFFLISFLLLSPGSLLASSWLELRSPHFIMRYQRAEKKMAAFLLSRAEETREVVLQDIGHTPPSPTLIYLAPTWGDFQQVQPGGQPPSWSVGTAYPRPNLIILRSPRAVKGGRTEIEEVLRHEYAHLALWTALKGQEAPHWLDEGFAMIQSRQWDLSWTYILAKGVLTKSLLPLEELEDGFPLAQHQAQLAYAESFSFVSFIKNEFGPKALPRLIKGMAHGLDVDTALRLATGLGLRELERRWKKELKRRYSWIPIVTSFFSLWFLASLLFLLSYWRKRRRTKRALEEWEREEALSEPPLPPGSPEEGNEGYPT
ncbi:MAG: hypothetical protein JRI46_04325 [Deltaproteobacteria bacterium]|nr:hypothetical protein [Deltaproteobacteria bacterium]